VVNNVFIYRARCSCYNKWMGSGKSFSLNFINKEQIAQDTYSFFFDRSEVPFDFLPGQYVRMTLPHGNPDDRGTSRYFTIASSPLQKNVLMLTVKILESSFKKALYHLQPGDTVQFFGPMGWFLLSKDDKQEKVFISGGIGITPFHSLLTTFADEKLHAPITLLAAFSEHAETLFYDELMAINDKHAQITIVYIKQRISEGLIKKHVKDIVKPVYYVVGSPLMVEATKELLFSMKISEEQIQTEDFTGY